MRRYIVLLLITGIVWAQTDFDTLVLKDGTTYVGEYSKIEEKIEYRMVNLFMRTTYITLTFFAICLSNIAL